MKTWKYSIISAVVTIVFFWFGYLSGKMYERVKGYPFPQIALESALGTNAFRFRFVDTGHTFTMSGTPKIPITATVLGGGRTTVFTTNLPVHFLFESN